MRTFLSFSVLLLPLLISAQIKFGNSSFEGMPNDATTPTGWIECTDDTTPDILPGFFGVVNKPSDGRTYVGLITRSVGSWEAIGQRISQVLKKGDCYYFQADVAHSRAYAEHNLPVKLRVWGGKNRCEKTQLLDEVKRIEEMEWQTVTIKFTPEQDIRYLIFEAYYLDGVTIPYNGNLLLDNLSEIKSCPRA